MKCRNWRSQYFQDCNSEVFFYKCLLLFSVFSAFTIKWIFSSKLKQHFTLLICPLSSIEQIYWLKNCKTNKVEQFIFSSKSRKNQNELRPKRLQTDGVAFKLTPRLPLFFLCLFVCLCVFFLWGDVNLIANRDQCILLMKFPFSLFCFVKSDKKKRETN